MDAVKDNLTDKQTDSDGIVENYEQPNHGVFPPRSTAESRDTFETVRSSARPKVFTAKMKDYRQQLLERDFDAAQKACTRQVKRIQSVLVGEVEISDLQQERGKLEARMDDFADAHAAIYDTLECEDKRIEQNTRYDSLNHGNREALRSLNEKISVLKAAKDDHSSILSSTSKHSRSSKCSKTSGASSSSLQKRAEMAARAARLEAELKFHDVESQKTAALKKHEDEIKKLHMMKELAATQVELEAVIKIEEENYGDIGQMEEGPSLKDDCSADLLERYLQSQIDSILQVPKSSDILPAQSTVSNVTSAPTLNTNVTFTGSSNLPRLHMSTSEESPQRSQSSTTLNPFASPFTTAISSHVTPRKPVPDAGLNSPISNPPVSSGVDLMQRLADLLTQRQDRDSLPRPEPEVFNGNPLRYPNWVKSFETFIERKTKDPSERLYYLGKYTAGAAKEAVSGLLPLDNVDAYSKAKKILTNRFGNPFTVADAFRKRINSWPKIQPNDGQDLRKFSDFLEHCNTAMKTIQYLNVLNDPDENQKIIQKLPNHLVVRWSRVVDEWIAVDELEEDSHTPRMDGKQAKTGYPPFAEFCKFMRKEARIACNPVTSPQALKAEGAKDKVEPGRSKNSSRDKGDVRVRTFATKSEEKSGNAVTDSNSKKIICAFCKNNHELDLCEKFSKIVLSERKKFVQTNALCWGCLKWGHVYKECRGRKTCRRCGR